MAVPAREYWLKKADAVLAALQNGGTSPDLDAISADIEMAKRSPEMARHVALDHGPELVAEVKRLRVLLASSEGGVA